MRRTRLLGVFLGTTAMLAASSGHAQVVTRDDLTSMLPCEGSCAVATRQTGAGPPLDYPSRAYIDRENPAEAVVELDFTVLPDGTIAEEIEVVRSLGPAFFVDAAKSALRQWKVKPATIDGQPVANTSRFRGTFHQGRNDRPVRSLVASAHDAGGKLIKEGKLDEAKSRLSEHLALPLNFWERTLLLHALALVALQREDFFEAQRHTEAAILFPRQSMSADMWRNLHRINLLCHLNLGNIVGAVHALDRWKKEKEFDPSDSLVAEVEAARKRTDALAIFAAKGRIPPADEASGFELGLYRRKFTFANVRGRLDRFVLTCQQKESRSPISEGVEWTIPRNFSNCFVFIKGEPGTTFDVVQVRD